MNDREICERIIENGGCICSGVNCHSNCIFDRATCGSVNNSANLAKQWLADHPKSPYTYAEVDLPDWWDGRPVKGEWQDVYGYTYKGYCIGLDPYQDFTKYAVVFSNSFYGWVSNFIPITETPTTAKVSITKDGKTSEIELTADQVKEIEEVLK